MRRRIEGGRQRRGRTGRAGGLILFERSLAVGEGWGLGRKEKLGMVQKKAQNGIKIKNISTTTSANSKKEKKKHLVLFFAQ
jgi:hypothetical protein